MKKIKKTKFTVHVQSDILHDACIEANSLKEALEIASSMTHQQLWDAKGSVIDTTDKITGVFS